MELTRGLYPGAPSSEESPFGAADKFLGFILSFDSQLLYLDSVERYGRRLNPYLSGNDPIILAAAPGTSAFSKTLPVDADGNSETVGPLAASIITRHRKSVSRHETPSLATLLRSTVTNAYGDRKEAVDTVPNGSISWSDFSDFVRVGGRVSKRPQFDEHSLIALIIALFLTVASVGVFETVSRK